MSLPTITAWSNSRLNTYEQCPFKAKLLYIDKYKEPTSEAMENGKAVHRVIELYLKGQDRRVPQEAIKLCADYEELFDLKPYTELQVAFNKAWQPVDWFSKDAWCRVVLDAMVKRPEFLKIIDHKGLALNTEIPTPDGFTTMEDIKVGDWVFDKTGLPCQVTHKSQVKTLPMFELQFKDGAKVVCDNEHIWAMLDGSEKTTPNLVPGDLIPLQGPINLEEADLPIHPYVLGYWLGNGRKRDGSICSPSSEIFHIIEGLGYDVGKNIGGAREGDIEVRTIKNIRSKLVALNLLDNKHIPLVYLRASYSQRVELLKGLMDSDGSANLIREEVVFSNTNRLILNGMRELLSTLGIRFRSNTGVAKGFGLEIKATQIAYRAPFNVFKYSPKAQKAALFQKEIQNFRKLKSITPIEGPQSQCIGVDSPSRTYLCTNRFIVTHNTGKMRDGYEDSLELYGLAGMLMFPLIPEVQTALYFVDAGRVLEGQTYTQADVPFLKTKWEDRVNAMLTDTEFRPTPNQYCGYCHFRRANGGPCTAA